jgi:diguanylate cyclase (GGDEF)-like protein/PAS domain S-box-containing protein
MNLTEPIIPIIRAIAGIAALLAWYEFGRNRGVLRRNTAFLALAMLGMVWFVTSPLTTTPLWLQAIGILSFGSHPLILVRLFHRFQKIPGFIQQIALLGTVYALAISILSIFIPLSPLAIYALWLYFILFESFICISALITSHRRRGMIRWRYRLVAVGASFFNFLLLLIITNEALPYSWIGVAQLALLPLLMVTVVVAYWAGLHPPRWLRQAWSMTEVSGFFDKMVAPSVRQKTTGLVDVLLSASEKSIEGTPVLALWQTNHERFQLHTRLPRTATETLNLTVPLYDAWQSNSPTYFDTIEAEWDGAFRQLAESQRARAGYVVPIATPHQKYGLLIIFLPKIHYFPSDDLNLLTYLCAQSASLLEIHQLMESQQTLVQNLHIHSQRNQRLNKIMESVSHASLDGNAILIAATRELSEQIGDGCVIHLLDNTQNILELAASYHTNATKRNEIHQHLVQMQPQSDEGIPATVLSTRKPLLVNYESEPGGTGVHRPLATLLNIHSSVHLPLSTGEQVLGLLHLFRDQTSTPYSYEDLRIVETVADRVALALENATLFKKVQTELEERSRAEKALRESESRFASILSMAPDAVISIDSYQRIVNFNRGAEQIFGYEAKDVLGQPVQFLFSDEPSHQRDILRRLQSPNTGPLEKPSHDGEPMLYWRRQDGSRFPGEITLSRLKLGGRLIRTLMLRDVTVRLRTEQETRRKTQILATMYATTLTLMDRLHVADSLETILRRAGQLLETEHGYVALLVPEGNHMEIKIGIGGFHNSIGNTIQLGVGISGLVWQTRELLFVNDYEVWEHRVEKNGVEGIHAGICIPLFAEHEVVGVLGLAHFEPNHTFDEQDIELLNLFAPLASIALYNAQLFAEVERLAKTDDLTGLLNRRAFFERADIAFQQARTERQPLAAIMLDIDHFKRVNDTFGHTKGDEVLRWIARECQKLLRSPDVLARYGGEEFALLLPNTTQEEAQRLAEQIRTHIAYHPLTMDRQSVRLSLSLGVAAIGKEMRDVNDLLNLADSRLYGAKAQGRNQVVGSGYPHPMYVR